MPRSRCCCNNPDIGAATPAVGEDCWYHSCILLWGWPQPLLLSNSFCRCGGSYWRGGRLLPLLLSQTRCWSNHHRSCCPDTSASITILLSGRPLVLARRKATPAPAVGEDSGSCSCCAEGSSCLLAGRKASLAPDVGEDSLSRSCCAEGRSRCCFTAPAVGGATPADRVKGSSRSCCQRGQPLLLLLCGRSIPLMLSRSCCWGCHSCWRGRRLLPILLS